MRPLASAWLLVAFAGQAAALLLIKAGRFPGYQHYLPLRDLIAAPPPALLVLIVQTLLVGAASWRIRAEFRTALARLVSGARLALVAAALVLTAATVSRRLDDFAFELVLASLVQLVQLLNVALVVRALGHAGETRAERDDTIVPGLDRGAWWAAGFVTLAAALLAAFVYQRHPHVPDEVVYLIHAKYFARGLLAMPAPPVPDAFNLDLFTYEASRWYSPVPAGWPLILAAGAWLGVPWLVNPVLGGVNILLTSLLLAELYPRRTVRTATLLLALSPWHLFLAMSLMTHTATLTCALLAALGVARLVRTGRLAWLLPGGIGIGMVGLIRPLEGVAIALPLGLWALLGGAGTVAARVLRGAGLAGIAAALAATTLPYNTVLTGRAGYFPIMAYTDRIYGPGTNDLGFGPNRGLGWTGLDPFPGHGPLDALINTNINLFEVNIELFGWGAGSLLFIALLLLGFRHRLTRTDAALAGAAATVIGLHAFYWFSGGSAFGARYWFLLVIPAVALAARGIDETDRALGAGGGGSGAALRAGLVLSVLALLTFVPWRIADKYRHFRGMRPEVRAVAARAELRGALVLVRGRRHPDYASAAPYNDVALAGDAPVFAWDVSAPVRARVLDAWPGRPVWFLDGPSVTHGAYRVAAGPLTTDSARAYPRWEAPAP